MLVVVGDLTLITASPPDSIDAAIPFALVLQHGPDRRLVGDKMMQIRVCSIY